MAVIETWFEQDLQKPVKVRYIDGNLFSHNGNGNRIGVIVTNNGEAVTLTGTVSGYAVLADGTTVPCTGTRSGNKASILVPAAAYSPGRILISIFLTDGTTVTTLAALSSSVIMARTGNQIDPGSVVTDWTNTINAAMQSVETAAANLGNIIATPYENLPFPVPLGKYTIYNNGLYRCISPIASSEAWTAAHWTNVKLGDDVADLKSAIFYTTNNLCFARNDYTANKGYNINSPYPATDDPVMISLYLPCNPGDVFYIKGYGTSTYRLWNFYNSENVLIGASAANMHLVDFEKVTIPDNVYYIAINHRISAPSEYEPYVIKNELIHDIIDALNENIIKRDTNLIAGTLPSDSIYADLNTIPANTFICYNNPTNDIANMPTGERKNFNIISFQAYNGTIPRNAVTQLFFSNSGTVYARTSWGASADFGEWVKLSNEVNEYLWNYHTILYNIGSLQNKVVIFSGDSITAGVTSYFDEATQTVKSSVSAGSGGYVHYLELLTGCQAVNVGVARSGYTADETSTTVLSKLETVSLDCDFLMIAAGTNDYGVTKCTLSEFELAINNTFNYVDAHCTGKVIILLPINRINNVKNSSGLYLSDYRQTLYEQAVKRNYYIIDCDSYFPVYPGQWQEDVILDYLHPTELGHRMFADSLMTALKQ